MTLAIALIWAISVFLWTGELQNAVAYIDLLISRADPILWPPTYWWLAVSRVKSPFRHGDAKGGVESLKDALQGLHATPYELLTTELNLSLACGLSASGQIDEAISLIDESLAQVESNGNLLYAPELLRVKGTVLLRLPGSGLDSAEACFLQAIELSRRHGARAWELRSAIDLAKLLAARGEILAAHDLLRPIFEYFVGGLGTTDFRLRNAY